MNAVHHAPTKTAPPTPQIPPQRIILSAAFIYRRPNSNPPEPPIHTRRRPLLVALLALSSLAAASLAVSETVPVRHTLGTVHGFLVIRNEQGLIIASGESIQTIHGDRITAHLVFHFRDGSLDDETTVFTQQKDFHLISDHHIQKGPTFPKPMDVLIEATGDVTVKTTAKDDTEKVLTDHLDLPADIANGLVSVYLQNLPSDSPEIKVAYVAATPKPRLVTLVIAPVGEPSFRVGGVRRKATDYRIKIDLGGAAAVIAPLVGKQPKDVHLWILEGEAPVFIREIGQLYEGGPLWRIEQTSAQFDSTPSKPTKPQQPNSAP